MCPAPFYEFSRYVIIFESFVLLHNNVINKLGCLADCMLSQSTTFCILDLYYLLLYHYLYTIVCVTFTFTKISSCLLKYDFWLHCPSNAVQF